MRLFEHAQEQLVETLAERDDTIVCLRADHTKLLRARREWMSQCEDLRRQVAVLQREKVSGNSTAYRADRARRRRWQKTPARRSTSQKCGFLGWGDPPPSASPKSRFLHHICSQSMPGVPSSPAVIHETGISKKPARRFERVQMNY